MDVTIFTSDTHSFAELRNALVSAGFSVSSAKTVRRTVLETFDGRLSAAGLRLEVREQHGQELILSGGGSAAARVSTVGVPLRADHLPAGPIRARLANILGVRALMPTLTLTACESTATKRDGSGKARTWVTVHEQLDVEGLSPIGGVHVEVTGVAGYPRDLAQVGELLHSWGLLPTDDHLVEVAAKAAGVTLGGYTISPTVALRRGEPAQAAFRRLLANLADTVDATWQGTVDNVDTEFLHDMRVAVRRTRSILSQGKRVLSPVVRRSYGDAFRWLGTASGRPRDLDVYLLEWDDYVLPLGPEAAEALTPVRDLITQQCREAHVTLEGTLRSARYRDLLAGWHEWLSETTARPAEQDADRPIGSVVASRTAHAHDLLVARGRSISADSPAGDLHELRKDAKKLRYLLECFGSLYPPTRRKAFVQQLKALQDNLGEHQDTEVHVGELRALPALLADRPGIDPATLVAIGQLTEQLERRRRAARAEFAERFSAYDTKDTRRSFQKLLRSISGPR